MNTIDLIIFDCDGVLIDSEGLAHQALIDILGHYGVQMSLQEALQRYMGRNSVDTIADIKSRLQITLPDDYKEKKNAHRLRLFEEKLKPIAGIPELLAAMPYKRCVASGSSLERLEHSLGVAGLWDTLSPHVYSAEQVAHGKPAPDVFLFAAKKMGVDPSACLVIEDSIFGVQAAKAANMRVFGFTGGEHCFPGHGDVLLSEGAERVFGDMKDIAAALNVAL